MWMFSLDHTHLEQWVLLFVENLLDLPFMHDNIYVFLKVILQRKSKKENSLTLEKIGQ